ncbi:MAG TPA: M23 family metallopeptidase [candidate division Zixibacteria bacterium]
MGRQRAGTIVFSLLIGLSGDFSPAAGEPYLWPLEDYTNVSGAFCDWRSRHYHGGIDVSVDGAIGIPVRAPMSGWVMRVSTSYWGFGKAVYLQMEDGRIAVFGHLSEFMPSVERYVEEEQYAARRYTQNLFPQPGEFPVRQGEIIGRTGQTGSGPPHLHFEIRTGDNKPLNPLVYGFEAMDKIAPSIAAVTVVPKPPLDPGIAPVLVAGGTHPVTREFTAAKQSRTNDHEIIVTGAVGIAALVSDHISASRWVTSPYRVRLFANGTIVTELAYDSINYDHTRQIDLERRFDGRAGFQPRPVNLFRTSGNTLWHYTRIDNDGWLVPGETLNPGRNAIRVEAIDAAGHETRRDITLTLIADTARVAPLPSRQLTIDVLPNGGFLELKAIGLSAPVCYLDRNARFALAGIAQRDGVIFSLSAVAAAETLWVPAIDDTTQLTARPLDWSPVIAGQHCDIESSDGLVHVVFGPDALYSSAYMKLQFVRPNAGRRQEGPPAYELLPEDVPLANAATLSMHRSLELDAPWGSLAVYRYRGSARGWSFEGCDPNTAAREIRAPIQLPGIFALLSDTVSPTIAHVTPGRGSRSRDTRPLIGFELDDDRSGIGSDQDVTLTIDDRWVPVEYDPDTHEAKARPRWELSRGEHRVVITARDRMGNSSEFLRILTIVP